MDAKQVLKKIVAELKRNKSAILSANIYDYEQEEIIENIILSVTGGSKDDDNFSTFKYKLLTKLGLYDDDPENNSTVVAYQIAVKLGCVKPFEGWKSKELSYGEVETAYNKVDGSYTENDMPAIISYLENHGVYVGDELESSIINTVYNAICDKLGIPKDRKTYWIHSDELCDVLNDLGIDEDEEEIDVMPELTDNYNLHFSCYENEDLDENAIDSKGYMTDDEYIVYNLTADDIDFNI